MRLVNTWWLIFVGVPCGQSPQNNPHSRGVSARAVPHPCFASCVLQSLARASRGVTSAKQGTLASTATSVTRATTTQTASARGVSATGTWTQRCPPACAGPTAASASAACTTPRASTVSSARRATPGTPRAPTAPGKVKNAAQVSGKAHCAAGQRLERECW